MPQNSRRCWKLEDEMRIDDWLNRHVTTSTSLLVEYGYWAPLVMAEARAKLMKAEDKREAKHLVKRIERLSAALK